MQLERLTVREIRARPVILPLERPIVARIATITEWPLILIDLYTEEGIVGRSYLEPYIPKAMKYLLPALADLGALLKGRPVAPVDIYEAGRKSLHFVGYEGLSMIAVAGLDMAAWDALAKAADVPLCVLLGGSVGAARSYNSNGLWLKAPEAVAAEAVELVAEGGFAGLKLRLGRERPADDVATIAAVRKAVGDDVALMVDYNQGLDLAGALARCRQIDDLGLAWIEEPIVYDNLGGYRKLAADLGTPLAIAGAAGIPMSTHPYPDVAAHVMRVTETAHWLEWQNWADPILRQPFRIEDGLLHIPNVPGVGIDWNEDAVAAHLADV